MLARAQIIQQEDAMIPTLLHSNIHMYNMILNNIAEETDQSTEKERVLIMS